MNSSTGRVRPPLMAAPCWSCQRWTATSDARRRHHQRTRWSTEVDNVQVAPFRVGGSQDRERPLQRLDLPAGQLLGGGLAG
jgi:hypothetical protein